MATITATGLASDQGSVVVFSGYDSETNRGHTFAVDHRMAQGLVDLLNEEGEVDCDVPEWAVLSSWELEE